MAKRPEVRTGEQIRCYERRIQTAEVARILGVSQRKVQLMAIAGTLPSAAKIDTVWTFDERQILPYLRDREDEAARVPYRVRQNKPAPPQTL